MILFNILVYLACGIAAGCYVARNLPMSTGAHYDDPGYTNGEAMAISLGAVLLWPVVPPLALFFWFASKRK